MTVLRQLIGDQLRVLSGDFRTIVPPGDAPFSVSTDTGGNAVITWSAPRLSGGSAITGYTVYVDGTPNAQGAAARSFTATGLTAGNHTFAVTASNAKGEGAQQQITYDVQPPPPLDTWGDGVNRTGNLQGLVDSTPDGTSGAPSVIDLLGQSIRSDQILNIVGRNYLTIQNGTIYTDDITGTGQPHQKWAAGTVYAAGDLVWFDTNRWWTAKVDHTAATADWTGSNFDTSKWTELKGNDSPRNRMHVNVFGSTNITFADFSVRGPNADGGINGPYYAELEGQSGINIDGGCSGITITGALVRGAGTPTADLSKVFGDSVYISGNSDQITVDGVDIHSMARQGVSPVYCTNVEITNCHFHDHRRSCADLEPIGTPMNVDTVNIHDNLIGAFRLNWIASKGGSASYVNNVTLANNDFESGVGPAADIGFPGDPVVRRSNWTITGTTSDVTIGGSAQAPIVIHNVDGVTVQNNSVDVADAGHALVLLIGCSGITVSGNNVGATGGREAFITPASVHNMVPTPGAAGSGTITLTWDYPVDGGNPVTDYVVSIRQTGTSKWTDTDMGSTVRSHDFTGLTAGTSYDFTVRAWSADGQGEYSSVVSAVAA